MEFCTRLKELRKEKKLTQTQVGKILGYGYTAIANYESGRNEPNLRDIIKLANIFQVSVDYLIGNSDIRYKQEKNLWKEAISEKLKKYDVYLENADKTFLDLIYCKSSECMRCETITEQNIDEVFKEIVEDCHNSISHSFFLLFQNKRYYEIVKRSIIKELNMKS